SRQASFLLRAAPCIGNFDEGSEIGHFVAEDLHLDASIGVVRRETFGGRGSPCIVKRSRPLPPQRVIDPMRALLCICLHKMPLLLVDLLRFAQVSLRWL